MSPERLIAILEEIRDQQKLQIANFERALGTQDEALLLQRQGRRVLWFLVAAPWAMMILLLGLFLLRSIGL